jgi:hypothetical protein
VLHLSTSVSFDHGHKSSEQQRCGFTEHPLHDAGILQRVLSYAGPGHWFFLSTVSSLWRDLYSRVAAAELVVNRHGDTITCVPQMTLYSSVFASPERVKFAHQHNLDNTTDSYQYAAGRYGTWATLVAARKLGMAFTDYTMFGAAECNQLPVLQLLHAQGCPWDADVADAAARRGAYEMLRWLREHGCEWNPEGILDAAATSGNIKLAAWVIRQPGVVRDDELAMAAAGAWGHTSMCAYLHAEGCLWSHMVCLMAAIRGHAETLQWLLEHGCPVHADLVCSKAAESGSVKVMLYLQQRGFLSTPAVLTNMLNAAGAHNKLAAAQWLRQQGAEWPLVLKHWSTSWSGDTPVWARAQGCTSPTP